MKNTRADRHIMARGTQKLVWQTIQDFLLGSDLIFMRDPRPNTNIWKFSNVRVFKEFTATVNLTHMIQGNQTFAIKIFITSGRTDSKAKKLTI